MNTLVLKELRGLTEQELEAYRKANHTREYFEQTLSDAFRAFAVIRHWRSQFGQKEAGVIEYRHELLAGDRPFVLHAFMAATFANGRRYTLNCNAPAERVETAKGAFDYIRSTTAFMH